METESVRSHCSEPSIKSKSNLRLKHQIPSTRSMGRSSNRSHQRSRGNQGGEQIYHSAVTLEETREGQEIIEVQILPQDENWGETQTHITSEQSASLEDLSPACGKPLAMEPWDPNEDRSPFLVCQRYLGLLATAFLAFAALVSPVAMVVLPKLGLLGYTVTTPNSKLLACKPDCKGELLSLSFKTAMLGASLWVLIMRRPRATLPRICVLRALVLFLLTIVLLGYWLFYLASLTPSRTDYGSLVDFANSLANILVFTMWIAVILLEIRQLQPAYCIKVVRSPDGESQCYAIGQLSVQRAALWVLDQYYATFAVYNPYLETMPLSKKANPNRSKVNAQNNSNSSEYKYYEVDNSGNNQVMTPGSRGSGRHHRDSSHNERFYEQTEYERRVRKRRARLEVATEEAFTHIRRLQPGGAANQPLDSEEAAQAIFPTLARALQKFLRVTRQQPHHSVESILSHLSACISFDLSPKAFLEPFFTVKPLLQFERDQRSVQSWALVCSELLSRDVRHGLRFVLRQGDVTLSCTVSQLPQYSITEQLLPASSNRFVLRMNSETSV